MKKEDMQKAMEALGKANINIAGDFVMEKKVSFQIGNVESGGIGIQFVDGKVRNVDSISDNENVTEDISKEVLGKALQQVQSMFWGQSSYAVIFCVMRDYYKYGDNMTVFEGEINSISQSMKLNYPCPPNTISSSFYNNTYLKMHIDKWEKLNVKPRSILLVRSFIEAVKEAQKE